MKHLFWILLVSAFIACQNSEGGSATDTSSGEAETAAAVPEKKAGPGAPSPAGSSGAPETVAKEQTSASPKEKAQPIIGTRPTQAPTSFAGRLTLTSEQRSAATGENICMKVMVGDFREVITMQYSVRWDPAILSFTGLRDLSLPYLSQNNFGTHRTSEGILTFVWIDNSLKGITLPDGSAIYRVCFDVKGTTGQSSAFRISGTPTPLESVNAEEKLLEIVAGEGKVTVK